MHYVLSYAQGHVASDYGECIGRDEDSCWEWIPNSNANVAQIEGNVILDSYALCTVFILCVKLSM